MAAKGGIEPEAALEHRPRIAEIPFDSAHKFMATFHHAGEAVLLLVKGAPDVLLARSSRWTGPLGQVDLDEAARAALLAENGRLATLAYRVLAVRPSRRATSTPAANSCRVWTALPFKVSLASRTRRDPR